jgi:cell wall-associated NlpC family hydrolase
MVGRVITICLFLALLAGCSGAPPRPSPGSSSPRTAPHTPGSSTRPVPDDDGERIANAARALIGRPYRFGGSGPEAFDCSGLVFYVHRQLGREVPRTALTQFRLAKRIDRQQLRPGDLVFFGEGSPEVTHVGVFVGDGEFVHAPKTGRPVSYARLDDEYFTENFAGAGRLR